MDTLSPKTGNVIEKLFPASEWEAVRGLLLEECTTKLPLAGREEYERIHLAILKISAGDVKKFIEAAQLAKSDWRDVLMWAGFGSDLEAHLKWARKLCSVCEG